MRFNSAIANPGPKKPFMTGIRLISWDDNQKLFDLRIDSLGISWKTLGPFQLEDQKDIVASHCYLKSEEDSLSRNLREIGKFMISVLQFPENSFAKPVHKSPAKLSAVPNRGTESLIPMPAVLKARPFVCVISRPLGPQTIFQADLATFFPGKTNIIMEGNVKVEEGNQTCLKANQVIWDVHSQELEVTGAYRFRTKEADVQGQDASFYLTGNGLNPVKGPGSLAPACLKKPVAAPIMPLMLAQQGKGSAPIKKRLRSGFPRTLLRQVLNGTLASMQRLALKKNQQQAGSRQYAKQKVYPPPPMKYTLEETIDRELFCEKSR